MQSFKAPPCDLQATFSVSLTSLIQMRNPQSARGRVATRLDGGFTVPNLSNFRCVGSTVYLPVRVQKNRSINLGRYLPTFAHYWTEQADNEKSGSPSRYRPRRFRVVPSA